METTLSRLIRITCLFAFFVVWLPFGMSSSAQDRTEAKTIFGVLADSPLWATYKKRFVGIKGNVKDNVNGGGISHSESQGYGMLLAAAANDKTTFDLIYRFAAETLAVRSDALHAWRYKPKARQAVSDTNNASDGGDILIAWALFEAADAGWGGDRYRKKSCCHRC